MGWESPKDWVQPCCCSLWVRMLKSMSHCSLAGRGIRYPNQARGERPAGRAPSPATHKLLPSHCRAELRLSWGAFCTGISQMSRGLTVLIKHLENLAGSPLHYAWCSRMFSGVLPLLCLLLELLPSSMSPFAHLERPSLLVQMGKQLFQTLGAQECPSIIRHTTSTVRWWGGHGEAEKAG